MKERNQAFRIVKLFGKAVAVAIGMTCFNATAQSIIINGINQSFIQNSNDILFQTDNRAGVAYGASISGAVTTTQNNQGHLSGNGQNSYGSIGANNQAIRLFEVTSGTNNVNGGLYALSTNLLWDGSTTVAGAAITDVTFLAAASLTLNGGLTGTLLMNGAAGTVNLGNGQTITGNVDSPMQMYSGSALNFLGTGTVTGSVIFIDNVRVGVAGASTFINGTLAMVGGSHLDLGSGTLTVGTLSSPGLMSMNVTATGNGTSFTSNGKIVATTGSMSGFELLTVNMNGGVANGAKFKLIDFANGSNAKTLMSNHIFTNSATLTFSAQSGNHAGTALDSTAGTAGEDLWVLASFSGGGSGADYGSSGNLGSNNPAMGAANALSNIANDTGGLGDMQTVINTFNMYSAEQLASEIRKLAPISNNSLAEAVTGAINSSFATISQRLRGLRDAQTETSANFGLASGDEARSSSFWLKGFGAIGKQDAKDFYNGYKANSAGVSLGADTLVGASDLRLGAAFSYAGTGVDQQDERTGDSTNIKSSQGTLYASQEFGSAYLDGLLAYARHDYKSHRATALSRTASADWNGTQWSARIDTGYRIPLGATTLTPLASLTWSRLKQDAYTESGAGALNLNVDAASTTRLRSGLGTRLQADTFIGGMAVKPEARLVWFHDFKDAGTDTTSSYTGGGASFSTPGQKIEKDALNIGLGMTVQPNKLARISLNYDFEGRSGYQSHAVQLTGRWDF